jgi:hypothetical protein
VLARLLREPAHLYVAVVARVNVAERVRALALSSE